MAGFQDILSRWPSRRVLADDCGVDIYAVHRWFQRGAVPARHYSALVESARARGVPLDVAELITAADPSQQPRSPGS